LCCCQPSGSIFIGLICGVAVVFSIEFIDKKLKIDDPVGAISVHGVCGALGFISRCFFAIDGGLLTVVDLKTRSSGYWVFSIAAWAMGASFVCFSS
jgi:Amt family ammonium transporter